MSADARTNALLAITRYEYSVPGGVVLRSHGTLLNFNRRGVWKKGLSVARLFKDPASSMKNEGDGQRGRKGGGKGGHTHKLILSARTFLSPLWLMLARLSSARPWPDAVPGPGGKKASHEGYKM